MTCALNTMKLQQEDLAMGNGEREFGACDTTEGKFMYRR